MDRHARPPDGAIDWVAETVGSAVLDVKPLAGGMSTGIHLLVTASGERIVLRRFLNPHWLAIDPDLATREAATLQALEPTAVPAPAFVGVDPHGDRCGAPAVLMGFVEGRRTVLDDLDVYARELARGMALVHELAPIPGMRDETAQVLAAFDVERPNRHGATPSAAFWSTVRDRFDGVMLGPPAFIHDDYHPGNVLFAGDALSAIVDWPLAASGQPACDVSFCRLDVGMMLGLDVADAVLHAYEAETGARVPDRGWWDLLAASRAETDLEVWTESYAGLAEVDRATVTGRFNEFVQRAMP